MRRLSTVDLVRDFMRVLGSRSPERVDVYFTGGATAVLYGWRETTIDVDIKIIPDNDDILRLLPDIKESQNINIELASPDDFIPELPGSIDRRVFIAREGKASFYHYDLYAQALAKIERGHTQDIEDAREMVRRKLVEPPLLLERMEQIQDKLYRYPAIDPATFRRGVETFIQQFNA